MATLAAASDLVQRLRRNLWAAAGAPHRSASEGGEDTEVSRRRRRRRPDPRPLRSAGAVHASAATEPKGKPSSPYDPSRPRHTKISVQLLSIALGVP